MMYRNELIRKTKEYIETKEKKISRISDMMEKSDIPYWLKQELAMHIQHKQYAEINLETLERINGNHSSDRD